MIYVNYWVNRGSQVVYLYNYTFDISQRVPGEKDRHTFLWDVYISRINMYMVLENSHEKLFSSMRLLNGRC